MVQFSDGDEEVYGEGALFQAFLHSVQLDVECPPCRDFYEPSMANSCWSSRAPLLCRIFP